MSAQFCNTLYNESKKIFEEDMERETKRKRSLEPNCRTRILSDNRRKFVHANGFPFTRMGNQIIWTRKVNNKTYPMLNYGSLYRAFNECMSCYTENFLFEKLARVHENPVKDIDELKERTLTMVENLSKSELVIRFSEEEQDQITNTSQVPLKRRRRDN